MLIRLNDGCYVAAEDVAEVRVNGGEDRVCVRTKSGVDYSLLPDYGTGVYATLDRLVTDINRALTASATSSPHDVAK